MLAAVPCHALSRDELRLAAMEAAVSLPGDMFVTLPHLSPPYAAAQVDDKIIKSAVSRLNFMRLLAGLGTVEADDGLNDLCANAAALMAVRGSITHTPEQPPDMADDFYLPARQAAGNSNLISFNWNAPDLAVKAIDLFAMDDTGDNPLTLAHRRWLLSPAMRHTGFGAAVDDDGRTYCAMYVTDDSAQVDWQYVVWPAAGAFPAELMTGDTPWSVMLNPDYYDVAGSSLRVTLAEGSSGAQFDFADASADPAAGMYLRVSAESYGGGPCVIFRPALAQYAALQDGYQQNQVWHMRLSGLVSPSGDAMADIEYTVSMASLTAIDPAGAEVEPLFLTLRVGDTHALTATVFPPWADDLSVAWHSSDEAIATVDANGCITALSPGQCAIRAETVNGRWDEAVVTIIE